MHLIYEQSISGRRGVRLPASDVPSAKPLPAALLRTEPADLPEVSELDTVRHFTRLSRRNYSVNTHFYPLGSCTMKYNVKALENAAGLFAGEHPLLPLLPGELEHAQGSLALLLGSEVLLCADGRHGLGHEPVQSGVDC